MERKEVYKPFVFAVPTANTSSSHKFVLDKSIRLVRGIQMLSDKPNQLYYRGSQRIEVSGDELFPEDYESKMLMSGISVAPDARWVDLGNGVVAGNGELKLLFKDIENTNAAFSPYKVTIVLKCELK